MPVYKYICQNQECKAEYKDLAKANDTQVPCPECGFLNEAELPTGGAAVVYETGDKYRGVQVKKNVQGQLRERMINHHDNYEIQEKIDKYGINDAQRNGWLKKVKKV